MNLSLIDPFSLAQEYPEILTHSFEWGHSTCIRFNKKGDYLASGLLDGTIVIFDFDTYGVVQTLKGHVRPIQSLSWSADGRYLLSASRDWKCIIWDLQIGKPLHVVNLGAPVWGAEFQPGSHLIFGASLYESQPKYIDFTLVNGSTVTKPDIQIIPEKMEVADVTENEPVKKPQKQLTLVVIFSRDGKHMFCGTSRGFLNVVCTESLKVVYSTRITSSNIKNLKLSLSGRSMVVNSSDRVIRLIRVPDLNSLEEEWDFEVEHKFQDVVNRLQWNSVTISPSGDYVLATTYESAHDIYMWETSMGSLVKIYEGPKEELVDVEFHPMLPAITSTGLDTGAIYFWSSIVPQKWSALAPDFVELEENIEYEEKEDEFDLKDARLENQRLHDEGEESVDILGYDNMPPSSFTIPIRLDVMEVRPGK